MAQAPYPVMNMIDGSTKMSDGTITMPDGTNFNPILPWNTPANTPINTIIRDTNWVASMAGRKNTPKVSTINPNTWFDYTKSSFTTPAPTPAYIQTGVWTTSVQSWPLPIAQVKPVLVQAPKPVVQAPKPPSNIVKIPEAEWVLQAALYKWLREKKHNEQPVIASNTWRINPKWKSASLSNSWVVNTPTPTSDLWTIQWTNTSKVSNPQQTPEQIAAEKEARLTTLKNADLAQKNLERTLWTDVLQTNNKVLMRLYWIDDKGNVDTTNKDGLAYKIEQSKLNYETQKNTLLWEYSSARLRKVQSQMRQLLTSRGIDITKIPPEQLIQLSGEVWNVAFNDIFTAKEKTVTDILQNWAQAEDKVNALRERWVISQNDLRIATETLRSKVLWDINTINRQFANDLFGIRDKKNDDIQSRKSAAINAITKFGEQIGLTGNRLWAITSYMNNFSNPTDALLAMTQDLANPNSTIYKTVWAVTAQQMAAAVSAMQLKQQEADAKTIAANARSVSSTANRPASVQWLSTSAPIIASITWKNLQDVTVDDFNNLSQSNTPQGELFRKYLSKWITDFTTTINQ